MTPMIDVVFLLLIFFVWTASFQIVEYALPSSVTMSAGGSTIQAEQPPPPEADFDRVIIRLTKSGGELRWQVNETPLTSLSALKARLEAVAAINRAAPVIVYPDPEIPLGDVIDVYDLARLATFEQIGFATSSTTAPD